MNNFFNKLIIKLSSKLVGKDEFGNSYFISKSGKKHVIYNGSVEASKVPPNWHLWLHNIHDKIIPNPQYAWQKIHIPNPTGTKYRNTSSKIKKEYQSWEPAAKNTKNNNL
jgi:NADH:ubiquinone oxidoreductase subunit|tara:strand:- start:3653 stop:3982 length:330 start_codon:yes stop_codon:yes gene_type:complete